MFNHKIAKTCIGNVIRKYEIDRFFIIVLRFAKAKKLFHCEVKWIARLNYKKPDDYNLTDGRENPPSMKGRKLSNETCAKMSAAKKVNCLTIKVCRIHIGIDTINLKGKGFKVLTKTNAQVKENPNLNRKKKPR